MTDGGLTRRAFIAAATTTAAAAITGCVRVNDARVAPRRISPNEKMNIAGIGVGGQGLGDIMACRHEHVVALADCDWSRAAEAFHRLPDARRFKDFRDMLEQMPEIDAVTISTPDHTHAPAAYMAMSMGKHVYVQKPLAHTIAEARFLTGLARETGVVAQMGNQGCSMDAVRGLTEMVWSGAIGEVLECHTWSDRPIWPQGIAQALPGETVPETMDWDLWIGPAAMRPYNKGYAPFNWRGWWDFGCGAIGDMAVHVMNPAFWALKLADASHFTVEALEADGLNEHTAPHSSIIKYHFPARADMGPVDLYWYDGGLQPALPEGVPETETLGDRGNGQLFIGTDYPLTGGTHGGGFRLLPESLMADYTAPEPWIPRVPGENHYQNWIDACKGLAEPTSPFEAAGPLTEIANFGNIALRAGVGERLEYDCAAMRITSHPWANALLTKEYRPGWELPL